MLPRRGTWCLSSPRPSRLSTPSWLSSWECEGAGVVVAGGGVVGAEEEAGPQGRLARLSQESFDLQLVTRNGHLAIDEEDRIY